MRRPSPLVQAALNTPPSSRRWASKHSTLPSPASDPLLQQYVGTLHFKELNLPLAEKHLLLSGTRDAARLLGQVGFAWSSKGTVDPSPYLLRLCLPFLLQSPPSIMPFRAALSSFLSLLIEADPSLLVERVPFPAQMGEGELLFTTLPTANWLQLVGLSVQRAGGEGAQEAWAELNKEYRRLGKPLLKEPSVKAVSLSLTFLCLLWRQMADSLCFLRVRLQAVAAIGQQVFGIAPPKGAGGNGLMDLMGSLFG